MEGKYITKKKKRKKEVYKLGEKEKEEVHRRRRKIFLRKGVLVDQKSVYIRSLLFKIFYFFQ
jgi:hypothetical protein